MTEEDFRPEKNMVRAKKKHSFFFFAKKNTFLNQNKCRQVFVEWLELLVSFEPVIYKTFISRIEFPFLR